MNIEELSTEGTDVQTLLWVLALKDRYDLVMVDTVHDEKNKAIVPTLCTNDMFAWACADLEEIRKEDIPDIKQAILDVICIDPRAEDDGMDLWVSRKRKMRLQGAAYPKNEKLHDLFNAAGPEREINMANPKHPKTNDEHV